jgi:tetratricopeptide (TPR) repeat protein
VLENKGKDLETAEIIDGYIHCRAGLTPEQKATLVFHAGQIYADLGKRELAIERMRQAYNKNLDQKYHWNSYVDGSIAFLERNLEKLKAARDHVQAAESDHPYVETLSDLIRCFNRPYKDFENCRNEKVTPAS